RHTAAARRCASWCAGSSRSSTRCCRTCASSRRSRSRTCWTSWASAWRRCAASPARCWWLPNADALLAGRRRGGLLGRHLAAGRGARREVLVARGLVLGIQIESRLERLQGGGRLLLAQLVVGQPQPELRVAGLVDHRVLERGQRALLVPGGVLQRGL